MILLGVPVVPTLFLLERRMEELAFETQPIGVVLQDRPLVEARAVANSYFSAVRGHLSKY